MLAGEIGKSTGQGGPILRGYDIFDTHAQQLVARIAGQLAEREINVQIVTVPVHDVDRARRVFDQAAIALLRAPESRPAAASDTTQARDWRVRKAISSEDPRQDLPSEAVIVQPASERSGASLVHRPGFP